MEQSLYEQFSAAIGSLPEADLLATLDATEHAVTTACRTAMPDAVFLPVGMTGRPVDTVLRVLAGRTVGEIGEVWGRLRRELADELVKRGADADVVREMREGGPRPGVRGVALDDG